MNYLKFLIYLLLFSLKFHDSIGYAMDTYLKFDNNALKESIDENKFKWLADICKRLKINPENSIVIDLGSGHGQNTIALAHHFHKVYGVEPSIKMLKFSRKLKKRSEQWYNLPSLRFYKGDFENIPIKQPRKYKKTINKECNMFV